MLGYTLAQLHGYLRAHARLRAFTSVAAMDAARIAANADADQYNDARSTMLDTDGRQQQHTQSEHQRGVSQALNLPADFWADEGVRP